MALTPLVALHCRRPRRSSYYKYPIKTMPHSTYSGIGGSLPTGCSACWLLPRCCC